MSAVFAPAGFDNQLAQFRQARASIERRATQAGATASELAAEQAERISQYRADLAAFDWHFEMADDTSVWRAGGLALKALRKTQQELDADGVIWRSVAPKGFHVPKPAVEA